MEKEENGSNKLELFLGLFLAIFAAMLAINDLGGGRYGDDEMIAHNKGTEAHNWYQSKSIKQSLVEGQRDMLKALITAKAIKEADRIALDSFIIGADAEVKRYKDEKFEILKGSANIDSSQWAQVKEGKLGQIVGAEEWEAKADALGSAGDTFDLASVFLQLCLVMGAMGLVLQALNLRKIFIVMMLCLGTFGTYLMAKAYMAAMLI